MLLTFEGLREGPEVSAAIDVPLRVTGRLRRKGLVAVLAVLGMDLVALGTLVGVRVLLILAAEDAGDALLEFLEDAAHFCRLL